MAQIAPLGPVYQAGTLSGNPVAMAAGLAQLRELERLDGWNKQEAIGGACEQGEDAVCSDRGAFAKFFPRCREAGVYFAPSQFETGFLSLAHTQDDIARTAQVV